MTNPNSINKIATVANIKYGDWTVTANIEFCYTWSEAESKYVLSTTHIGTLHGDIVAVHPNAAAALVFSNNCNITAVEWAKMTVKCGMEIGNRGDWYDAIYNHPSVREIGNNLLNKINEERMKSSCVASTIAVPTFDSDIMDIATMLRAADRLEPHLCAAAAAAIERLRAEVADAYSKSADVLAKLSASLCTTAALEREKIIAERDEARRMLCAEWAEHGPVRLNKEQIAMRYGWDCFKENA